MNKLEIFQEVYGKDYVFTETELSRLLRIAELVVRESVEVMKQHSFHQRTQNAVLEHFGVK
jgi:hypothetical protein